MTTVSDNTLVERIALECAATLSSGRSRLASILVAAGGSVDLFLELVQPPLPLLICGAGHDAVPLARIAAELGWAVTVFEPRSGAAARADRFPCADAVIAGAPERLHELVPLDSRTAAIVMSHNTFLDTALLDQLLRSPAQYIGALGPRHRTDRLLAELRDQGKSLPGLERLHAPVGIDIGATDPASIALSILAEIQACVSGRAGGSLRDLAVANRQDRPDNDFAAAANPRTGTCSLITSLPASA